MSWTPPHSIDAERIVLGSLLNNPRLLDEVIDALKAEDFFAARHQQVFATIVSLATSGRAIDLVSVTESMRGAPISIDLPEVGDLAMDAVGYGISHHAQRVRECALLRGLAAACQDTLDEVFTPPPLHQQDSRDVDKVLDRAEQRLFALRQQLRSAHATVVSLAQAVPQALARIEERARNPGVSDGLSTGFGGLDRLLGGLHPGDLVIVAGRPGMGKTALAMNFAEHAALHAHKNVLVFSLEMPVEQLVLRLLAAFSRVSQSNLRSGLLDDREWSRLSSAVGMMQGAPLYIDETPALDPLTLRRRARRMASQQGLQLIVVDYLGLMQIPGYTENRTQLIGEISRSLKALAKELKVPVIVLSQLNRTIESREDKEPRLSDLRDSGAIEQDADVILFVQREAFFNRSLQGHEKGKAKIIVAKHRNGPVGEVPVIFEDRFTRFDDAAMGEHY